MKESKNKEFEIKPEMQDQISRTAGEMAFNFVFLHAEQNAMAKLVTVRPNYLGRNGSIINGLKARLKNEPAMLKDLVELIAS